MTPLRLAASLALAFASPLAFAQFAHADVLPPPGYVEVCTVAQQQTGGARCEECRASFQDANACATRFASTQLQQRCKTSGASVWTEVWCETGVTTDPTTPAPVPSPSPAPEATPATSVSATQADEASCAVAAPGSSRTAGLALFGVIAAFGVALRRRVRR